MNLHRSTDNIIFQRILSAKYLLNHRLSIHSFKCENILKSKKLYYSNLNIQCFCSKQHTLYFYIHHVGEIFQIKYIVLSLTTL